MADEDTIPQAIRQAYALLKDSDICQLVGSLKRIDRGLCTFRCRFTLPVPNASGLPEHVTLMAVVCDAFPHRLIEFFPLDNDEDLRGFAHQDAETGKLCLHPAHRAPADGNRLAVYVGWAREWLLDAANNTLLRPGDPFELPDFSRKRIKVQPPTRLTVFFDESPETFPAWQQHVGQTGIVELRNSKQLSGLFAQRFLTGDGELIRTTAFAKELLSGAPQLKARWLLLPNVTVHRHRPAQTYGELLTLCNAHHVSLQKVLKKAWRDCAKPQPFGVLLVGFPIPRIVGDDPVEIHWQPLMLPSKESTQRLVRLRRGKRDEGRLWNIAWNHGPFAKPKPLLWGKTDNLCGERQYSRGSHSEAVSTMPIALVGCGALGSPIAEALVRGGVQQMALFDEQSVEFGNLCRHTLDGRHVGRSKATALATRLRSANPVSRITSHDLHVPWSGYETGTSDANAALDDAHVLIDCATDNAAFRWMSRYCRGNRKRLASLFINPYATLLTLVLSGKQTSALKVFRALMRDIDNGTTLVDPEPYFSDLPEQDAVLPGAGCWHATFPALNSHIVLLAYAALEHIAAWMDQPLQCDGYGILIRRNGDIAIGPSIETIWKQRYR